MRSLFFSFILLSSAVTFGYGDATAIVTDEETGTYYEETADNAEETEVAFFWRRKTGWGECSPNGSTRTGGVINGKANQFVCVNGQWINQGTRSNSGSQNGKVRCVGMGGIYYADYCL